MDIMTTYANRIVKRDPERHHNAPANAIDIIFFVHNVEHYLRTQKIERRTK